MQELQEVFGSNHRQQYYHGTHTLMLSRKRQTTQKRSFVETYPPAPKEAKNSLFDHN